MQEYNNTDRQLHWLSQIIAKVNKAFVPEKIDDSHTNLYYDPVGDKIVGRWIESSEGKIILSLNIAEMRFDWLNKSLERLVSVTVFNKPMSQIEKELARYPAKLGMEAATVFQPLHFEIPDYGIKSISEENISEEGLAAWRFYRQLANDTCFAILGYLQSQSEIRIWPHHFDTGIYVQQTDNLGIGFGLAMKDDMVRNAYFYAAGYKNSGSMDYVNLPKLSWGHWETGTWKGAILSLQEIPIGSIEQAGRIITGFAEETVNWFLNPNR